MVRPRVVSDSIIDRFVRVPGTLRAKLPDGPAITVLVVEEGDQAIERVTVGSLGVGLRRSGPVQVVCLLINFPSHPFRRCSKGTEGTHVAIIFEVT